MTKITSRDEPDDPRNCIKVTATQANYRPAEMTDKTVYELAQHYYTVERIADHFSVSAETVLKHHGEAFRAGKANAHMLPRFLMRRYFEEMNAKESLTKPEVIPLGDGKFKVLVPDINEMRGMMELHARQYEGLGKETAVTVTNAAPTAADIKFTPLTLENKDDEWTK